MLYVDFMETGAPECPFLRIYGTDQSALQRLQQFFEDLGSGLRSRLDLHDHCSLEFQADLKLSCMVTQGARGVTRLPGTLWFTWSLDQSEWNDLSELIAPLLGSGQTEQYQWLAEPTLTSRDAYSGIPVLLSVSNAGVW